MLDREEDTVSIAKVDRRFVLGANTVLTHLMDDFLQQGVAQGTKHVRILTREHMADIYVDDQWIFSSDMKDLPTKGKLGFFVESGKATISNLHVAEVEPLR